MQRLIVLVCLLGLTGCDEPSASSGPAPGPSNVSAPPPPPPGATDPDGANVVQAEEPAPPEEPAVEREVARVGVGKKGRNYGGGVITEPIRQYFRASQRINLLNMQHAMRLYKAEHGKLPATHEDFMTKIIEANSIELPELPDGERYVYDPEKGELMVERPKP